MMYVLCEIQVHKTIDSLCCPDNPVTGSLNGPVPLTLTAATSTEQLVKGTNLDMTDIRGPVSTLLLKLVICDTLLPTLVYLTTLLDQYPLARYLVVDHLALKIQNHFNTVSNEQSTSQNQVS